MSMKTIQTILPPPQAHMVGDGFNVHNFFPSGHRIGKGMSPFYLMDYNAKVDFPPTDQQRGVGIHPHRGFETVTVAYHGKIAHHDSAGNNGVIGEGDVQWMTAGSGILHKEYHESTFSRKGGPFQMVQLWVNLPSKYKMTPPKYQPILHQDKGVYTLDNGTVYVIAGEYKGIKGPAKTFTPIHMYDIRLNKNALATITFPAHFNTGILVIDGQVSINESAVAPANHFIFFNNEGEDIGIEATENSILLVLSGEPIHEPIAQYGPFLMNTPAEIQQAIQDFNEGKFGHLED